MGLLTSASLDYLHLLRLLCGSVVEGRNVVRWSEEEADVGSIELVSVVEICDFEED